VLVVGDQKEIDVGDGKHDAVACPRWPRPGNVVTLPAARPDDDEAARALGRVTFFRTAATNSFNKSGLLLLIRTERKSVAEGMCLPVPDVEEHLLARLEEAVRVLVGLPSVTTHLSFVRSTVHFSSSSEEK
jgi:hypothetical protein